MTLTHPFFVLPEHFLPVSNSAWITFTIYLVKSSLLGRYISLSINLKDKQRKFTEKNKAKMRNLSGLGDRRRLFLLSGFRNLQPGLGSLPDLLWNRGHLLFWSSASLCWKFPQKSHLERGLKVTMEGLLLWKRLQFPSSNLLIHPEFLSVELACHEETNLLAFK